MQPVERKHVERLLKKFAKPYYLPRTVYRERCNVEAESVCDGKGNTCASEDHPETWEEWKREFCKEHGYHTQEIQPVLDDLKAELEDFIPMQREDIEKQSAMAETA